MQPQEKVMSLVRPFPAREVYHALFTAWGPQHWWPGRTRLEMMVGAILTQNTAWTNVEKAIRILRREKVLSFGRLEQASEEQLAEWIRPTGYFRVKARRLKAFIHLLRDDYGGNLNRMLAQPTDILRARLLSVNGIGPETADSILLYAGGHCVFVVDAYTRRFLTRHGWADEAYTYDDLARLFTEAMPCEAEVYNEFHALIVHLGKEHCLAREPKCAECPLRKWLL
ncbi:MAG: endonuclease III domain-containing protein [Kiritimatiellae bacterium]|nr:endonuclease III domain-containing protein [Kiritimatiellia bacterium]